MKGSFLLSNRIEYVKRSVSIVKLFNHFKFDVRHPEKDHQVHCPFHDDRSPSARLFVTQDSFYCWTCGKGGDIFWVVQQTLLLDFMKSVEWLESTFDAAYDAASYETRFARATAGIKKSEVQASRVDLHSYWSARNRLLSDRMIEFHQSYPDLDKAARMANLSFLVYVFNEVDDMQQHIGCGEIDNTREVSSVFDWASSCLSLLHRQSGQFVENSLRA